MTERQKYQVIREFDGFELRRYEPCVIAEVEMSDDYQSATYGAFRHLFNYISKGNETSKSIAMTAPVSQQGLGNSWTVRFIMPRDWTMETLPAPSDARVSLRPIPAKRVAVIRFSGLASASAIALPIPVPPPVTSDARIYSSSSLVQYRAYSSRNVNDSNPRIRSKKRTPSR